MITSRLTRVYTSVSFLCWCFNVYWKSAFFRCDGYGGKANTRGPANKKQRGRLSMKKSGVSPDPGKHLKMSKALGVMRERNTPGCGPPESEKDNKKRVANMV